MTPNGDFGKRQQIFPTIEIFSVALAEGADAGVADCVVGTLDCEESGRGVRVGDTSTDWLALEGFVAPFSILLAGQFRVD